MKAEVGYYSIIQFCPDIARHEAANVGLVLVCNSRRSPLVCTSPVIGRVRRFFQDAAPDVDRLRVVLKSIERRLLAEPGTFLGPEELRRFAATLGNYMRLTPPEAVALRTTPEELLVRLYEQLVGGRTARSAAKKHDLLAAALAAEPLSPLIERDPKVILLNFAKPFTAPYGYQNGTFNLIKPVRFNGLRPTELVKRAGQYAFEGDLISRTTDPTYGKLKLIVVGQFTAAQHGIVGEVGRVLEQNHAAFYRSTQIDALVREIRENGRPLELRMREWRGSDARPEPA